MIPVTKPYLPSRKKLDSYIDGIYERRWLTNGGPLEQLLTKRLEEYLGVDNLLLVSNGTLALQIAYKSLGVNSSDSIQEPEAITTPFTFVATASSLQWEGITPLFADIDQNSWCLSPANIDAALTKNTKAIVPVHVFGNTCDVEAINIIAEKHKLKVVYDASHAFGVKYKGKSILNWGDAATLSFHATKLFHTIEGGAIIFKDKADLERAKGLINFGLTAPDKISSVGINAKMNEFQAAMGLCILDEIDINISARREIIECYHRYLPSNIKLKMQHEYASENYAYMPIILENEEQVFSVLNRLSEKGVFVRRYFYPSLNNAGYGDGSNMPVSENISKRIICLPLYDGLLKEQVLEIVDDIKKVISL